MLFAWGRRTSIWMSLRRAGMTRPVWWFSLLKWPFFSGYIYPIFRYTGEWNGGWHGGWNDTDDMAGPRLLSFDSKIGSMTSSIKEGPFRKWTLKWGSPGMGPKLIQNLLKISKHHPRSVRNHRSFEFLSQFRAETPAFAPHFRVWGSSPSCCRRAWRDPCSFYTTWEMHQLRGMPWSTMACLKSLRTRLDPPQWY